MPTLQNGQIQYQAGEALPTVGSSAYTQAQQGMLPNNNPPAGWDATTYANFKQANPTLEPNAQDTQMMLGAGNSNVNTPSTFNAGDIGTQSMFSVPKGTPTSLGGFVNSLQSTLPQMQNQVANQGSELDRQLASIAGVNTQIGQKGQDQSLLEQQYGVPKFNQQLSDLNTQIAQKSANYNNQYQAVEGQGYSQGLVSGLQALNRTRAAVELGGLASVQQALQGNIQNAISLAQHTVDLKYEPIMADLKNKQMFYEANKENFTASQKRLADRQNLIIDTQLKKIESDRQQANQNIANAISLLKDGLITGQQAGEIMNGKSSLINVLSSGEQSGRIPKGTTAQFQAAGFANRQEQANSVFQQLDAKLKDMSYGKFQAQLHAPNALKSPEMQQFSQAVQNYVTAQLRWESGAAISQSEINTAIKEYIPAPGDSDAVLKQKEQNRLLNKRNLIAEASTAYVPLGSGLTPTILTPEKATAGITNWVKQSPSNLQLFKQATEQFPQYSATDIYQILGIPNK